MPAINQSPANQASVAISGLSYTAIVASGTPDKQSRKIVGDSSVAVSIGGGLSPLPTSGQIWPLGLV